MSDKPMTDAEFIDCLLRWAAKDTYYRASVCYGKLRLWNEGKYILALKHVISK